jgi:general secretion pathway protein D
MNGLTLAAVKGSYTYNGVEYLNVGALLRALQSDGDVNILSTPNIVTMDNQKAEIMAGENIPVITGQLQSTSTGSSISNSVERKDVGVTLKLTPQIMSDETVRLDIYQEISAVTTIAGLDANVVGPSTTKRTVSTSVVVKDGETIVIGGLMRDNVNSSMSKVPLLGDIPLFGWFFRYKTTKVEKTNLIIFITPTIIKNDNDAMDLTTRKIDDVERFRDEHRMLKKDKGDITNSSTPEVKSTATGQLAPGPVEPRKDSTTPLQEPSEK